MLLLAGEGGQVAGVFAFVVYFMFAFIVNCALLFM